MIASGRAARPSVVPSLEAPPPTPASQVLAADFIGTYDEEEQPGELKHIASLLEKSANRMMRMLQELLDFSTRRSAKLSPKAT